MKHYFWIQKFILISTLLFTAPEQNLFSEISEWNQIFLDLEVQTGLNAENKCEKGIHHLLLHTLFFGTKTFSHNQIVELLELTDQDISANGHITISEHKVCLSFKIPREKECYLETFMSLVEEMAFKATCTPLSVEMARSEILQHLEEISDQEHSETSKWYKKQISCLTAKRINRFYKKWFTPNRVNITLSSHNQNKTSGESLDVTTAYIKHAQSNTVIIDGKIFMNAPSWTESRWYGRWFGIFCVALGVLTGVVLCILNPALIIIGIVPLFAGVYFISDPYLNDPAVIKEKRQEDLLYGFNYAYKSNRAEFTLTPYERRNLFVKENAATFTPKSISHFPIAYLADCYNFRRSLFIEMFYDEEIEQMEKIKSEFLCRRNEFTKIRYQLEEELNSLLVPHQILRDMALDKVLDDFENNPAILALEQYNSDLEFEIDLIIEQYQENEISSEERDYLIDEIEEIYFELMNQPSLIAQAEQAKEELEEMQEYILYNYNLKVNECKIIINYDERINAIEEGKWVLYEKFNNIFAEYVASMEIDDSHFDDYIDRRS